MNTSDGAAIPAAKPAAVPAASILDVSADAHLAAEVRDLQRDSYRIEAALIGSDSIPPLHESLVELRGRTDLVWLGVRENVDGHEGRVIAAIAVTVQTTFDSRAEQCALDVDIDRLVVSPSHLRRGLGRILVSTALDVAAQHAPEGAALTATVSTGRANSPARALYESMGFEPGGETEVEPLVWMVNYRLHRSA